MILVVAPTGQIRALYDEAIDLTQLGQTSIRRVGHVDPGADGLWIADLSPTSGPILGPFALRSEALDAEIAWLETYRLGGEP